MKRLLSEQQVLKKLDIPDFRHLTKDKVISFASMLPKMNPEVAKKALEQFPDFASTSLEVMKEYKGIIEKAINESTESRKACIDMYNRVMDSLEKMLDKEHLTFEDQKFILEQMKTVAEKVDEKDTEEKKFLIKAVSIAGVISVGIIAALGSTLGSNINAGTGDDFDIDI